MICGEEPRSVDELLHKKKRMRQTPARPRHYNQVTESV